MAETTTLKHRSVVYKGCSHFTDMGNVEDHSIWFLSHPALFMSEGASLGELEDAVHPMFFPPQLILHWKVRAQEVSRMHFHMAFPTAPCQNKGVLGEGRSCAKHNPAHSPSRRGDGSVQMRPSRPEELRCLVSITPCSGSGTRLTFTDVNTFGCASPRRGLWATQGENSQLWASPSWAQ